MSLELAPVIFNLMEAAPDGWERSILVQRGAPKDSIRLTMVDDESEGSRYLKTSKLFPSEYLESYVADALFAIELREMATELATEHARQGR